jgi:hypothetical protein
MAPPVDLDDFSAILASEVTSLPALPSTINKGNGGTPTVVTEASGWASDPLPAKLDKIRAVFLNAKSPTEVYAEASLMPVGDWLEMVVKMSPKDVKVSGGIAFRHMLADMGPIDKSQYRPQAVQCDYEEVVE